MKIETDDSATQIDPNESEGLIPSLRTQAELNEFEALNILDGTLWAQSSKLIRKSLLKQETLKLLHKRMFGNTWSWAGSYRKTQKSIGCDAWQIAMHLKQLEDDFASWLKFNSFPPSEIAARFHHRLAQIHPFPNGNGRFARLATDLLCEQQGWEISSWGFENSDTSEARTEYISSLRMADSSEYANLIRFMFPESR